MGTKIDWQAMQQDYDLTSLSRGQVFSHIIQLCSDFVKIAGFLVTRVRTAADTVHRSNPRFSLVLGHKHGALPATAL